MTNVIFENLFYLGTLPLVTAIVHYFFNSCLGCHTKNKLHIFILYFIFCLTSGWLYLTPYFGKLDSLLNLFMLMIISNFYKGSFRWKVGAVMFISAVIILSDMMIQSFLMIIFPNYTTDIYIISLFLSKLVMIILTHIAVQLFTSYGEGYLPNWYWVFLIFCPFISFSGLYVLTRYMINIDFIWLYPTMSIGLLFINFFVFILCDYILRLQTMKTQTVLLEKQINYYTNQYLLAESCQKKMLKFRHDIKNVLIGLQAKLKAGEISGSKQIVDTLIDDFNSSKGIAHSGNLIVDSIINYKYQEANSSKITFNLDLRLPADIILDPTFISVILGNALDNAIEACQQIISEKKYIKIKMHYQNENLFIYIENPYTGYIRKNLSGKILSSKSDYQSHGIGLKSICDMIEKLGGLLNIDFKDSVFKIEAVLFNIKRERNKQNISSLTIDC